MIIGLTGGIASGKTTAACYLKELGARVISADQVSREIMAPGQEAYRKVWEQFGEDILTEEQKIDRSRLGEIIFSDKKKRKQLEEITHPLIIKKIKEKIGELQDERKKEVIVVEAPLLFEVGMENMMDQIWVVYCDRETQIERLVRRDNLSRAEACSRIDTQMPLEEKKVQADVVIRNCGSREELKNKVYAYWQKIVR